MEMDKDTIQMIGRIDERTSIIVEGLKDHDQRINKLEDFRWWLVGGGTAIAGVATLLFTLL